MSDLFARNVVDADVHWDGLMAMVPVWDGLIDDFNAAAG